MPYFLVQRQSFDLYDGTITGAIVYSDTPEIAKLNFVDTIRKMDPEIPESDLICKCVAISPGHSIILRLKSEGIQDKTVPDKDKLEKLMDLLIKIIITLAGFIVALAILIIAAYGLIWFGDFVESYHATKDAIRP